jgi:hypothetical protein
MKKEDSGMQGRMDDFSFVVVSSGDKAKQSPKQPAPKKK